MATIAFALLMSIVPLPAGYAPFRPEWVAFVLL
jgi:cell shape-determining protein MreD